MRKSILLFGLLLNTGMSLLAQDASQDSSDRYLEKFIGKPVIIGANYQEVCAKLGIPYDGHTADSFSVRLWSVSMMGYELLIVNINGDKVAVRRFQYLSTVKFLEKPVSFKTSPGQLLLDIEHMVFTDLVSQEQIPRFRRMVDDGISYFLEAVTKDEYYCTSYNNPCSYNDPDNKKFCSIINLLGNHIKDVPKL